MLKVALVVGSVGVGLYPAELEARLAEDARALARQVLQDQLDLRARVEQRADGVIGADATPRRAVERGHERDLQTVLGEVQVTRLAYRAAGSENLYPADARLNLPPVRHSHGVRRLAALRQLTNADVFSFDLLAGSPARPWRLGRIIGFIN